MHVVAVLPGGLEQEGCKELAKLGATRLKASRSLISFEADMSCLYRIHLRARLPFRFLREIARFKCNSPESLYEGVQKAFDWCNWLKPSFSFRVDASGSCSELRHTHYSALQVKNALVDLQKNLWDHRSIVNLRNPDICLHLHLFNDEAVLSIDGCGKSLHRRGYRAALGSAPLKENLACGLMRLTEWNGFKPLVDPLCGSATFLIEAALDYLGIAPGLNQSFIINNWYDYDLDLWNIEKEIAKKTKNSFENMPLIIGCERDSRIAEQARKNVAEAGLADNIKIHNLDYKDFHLPDESGTIVCNPPYGIRVGFDEDLETFYSELGYFLKSNASNWQLWMLSGNSHLTRFLRMKSSRKIPINNGGIDCRWLNYSIN